MPWGPTEFKSEFAKGLCSSTNPADEFLFGGDTAKRIKEIAELNKNKVCKAPPSRPQGRGQRFSPYPQRGFRGYIRGRGRAFRGRGSGLSGYQQQQRYFQHAPQSEKKSGSRASQNWYVNYECDTVKAKISNQPPFKWSIVSSFENSRDSNSLSPLSGAIALHTSRQSSLAFSMIFFLSASLALFQGVFSWKRRGSRETPGVRRAISLIAAL